MNDSAHNVSGELYFHLHNQLGFGRLTMFLSDLRPGRPTMVYQWWFETKHGTFGAEHHIGLMELARLRCPRSYAFSIARQWKNDANKPPDEKGDE